MAKRVMIAAACLMIFMGATVAVAAPAPVKTGSTPKGQFESAEGCGCHSQLVQQWSQTMHAQALTDPLYQTKLKEAQEATDGKLGEFCNSCHGPAATMLGVMDKTTKPQGAGEGVTCSWCHQVTGLAGKPANTSHLVLPDGTKRAQIKDPQAPHKAAYSQFHETAEFCGGCHNVDHPINGMHLEATYTEWKQSPWAKEGVVCQDCHMSAGPGEIGPFTDSAAAGAPQRDNMYAMTFVGGQVALGPSDLATKRLQSAATMELVVDDIVESGEETSVTVTVTNSGAGHYLPTGLTEVRQMWLDVYAEDAEGGKTPIGERRFGTILKDAKGRSPVELWEATAIASDDRIPPRGSITEEYSFALPDGVDGATIKAELKYQSATDEFAKKAGVDNPTTVMVSAERAVFASAEARAAAFQRESTRETPSEAMLLGIALGGLVLVAAAVVFFVMRGRSV